ncbi:MAG: UDP-N-acetylmuramoyl-L-alanyl-D-glutamate--2,6-diaminopimelate ligase [Crocinitomicaceae bacterium]|jgi:UDP-N-acetylmuramoyl-L-alanyl-D-glutamate--2,6-diaminopimelate ligase|nr:UDP-N-acetylmuramoyl-L-alanyl-D-glutamate--2,6-diaminopimelate ligase [Crocinitomicaceae bacterium]
MRLLKDIIYGVRIENVIGSTNIAVEGIDYDSRKVVKFGLFVAIPGTQVDGHEFISTAISSGAVSIICEKLPQERVEDVTYILVKSASKALGIIASNFYNNPSHQIKLIGVTGTNGKTTTVTLMYNLYRLMGFKVGLLSTVVNKIHSEVLDSTHTTPNALELNKLLSEMVEKGCTMCFMEVSSHAVAQSRIEGLRFAGGVFTNITREHLDYHGTFDNYIIAKKGFFDSLSTEAFALVNNDQSQSETMVQDTPAKVFTYGINSVADYKVKILENHFNGLHLNIDGQELYSKLIGRFNAYNILAAYSTAVLLGHDKIDVLTTISNLNSVQGRFEYLKSEKGVVGIVDYAHTPDALENVLKTIKDIRTGNEMVITVVGCGGDRDRGKRPLMGRIACQFSDQVIFTSDNPRTEDPNFIIEEMQKGVEPIDYKKTVAIPSRKEAIKMAVSIAHAGDILLIAGKGHENYQIVGDQTLPFDDMQVLNETLKVLDK